MMVHKTQKMNLVGNTAVAAQDLKLSLTFLLVTAAGQNFQLCKGVFGSH
jgi:hypothetical protein